MRLTGRRSVRNHAQSSWRTDPRLKSSRRRKSFGSGIKCAGVYMLQIYCAWNRFRRSSRISALGVNVRWPRCSNLSSTTHVGTTAADAEVVSVEGMPLHVPVPGTRHDHGHIKTKSRSKTKPPPQSCRKHRWSATHRKRCSSSPSTAPWRTFYGPPLQENTDCNCPSEHPARGGLCTGVGTIFDWIVLGTTGFPRQSERDVI
jgi:hypothetical protein